MTPTKTLLALFAAAGLTACSQPAPEQTVTEAQHGAKEMLNSHAEMLVTMIIIHSLILSRWW
ncbi:hypothetical protein ACFQMB_16655 [Pseudobowmanella zhangzhouensis]|uniref:hypothetical protein n=1 Tax=Pseudobowmanella zhangzhouensis TaxID=1537679 RepID=UPI0036226159